MSIDSLRDSGVFTHVPIPAVQLADHKQTGQPQNREATYTADGLSFVARR